MDFIKGPYEGGVLDPALVRSVHVTILAFDAAGAVPDDATDGADELNDFGSGKAEGRTV